MSTRQRHICHVLLIKLQTAQEKEKLVGVTSDRDLLKSLCPWLGKLSKKLHGRSTLQAKAHRVMSLDPISLFKDV
ncbi:MAG: CBS domain-containing protein [Candidatus Brocadiaceae bacterium]|nr:CBS domain-containing protein [Candidatus Brocadiaceae bacterium]